MTKTRIPAAFVVSIVVVSCAPKTVGGNAYGVMVDSFLGSQFSEAFRLAEAHCSSFGRSARSSSFDLANGLYWFDCIERPNQ